MEENKNIPTTEGEAIAPEAPATDIPGTDAPSPDLTAGVPQQEQTGATMAEPGDVVVSFDKIEELMAERRAAARDTVEKAEPAATEVEAPAVEPVEPISAAKEPEKTTEEKPQEEVAAEQKKSRRGRPPKAEKTEQAAPEADKEQTAAKPRRGRPPKADKAAPDEAGKAPEKTQDGETLTPAQRGAKIRKERRQRVTDFLDGKSNSPLPPVKEEAQPSEPRDKVSRGKKAAPAKEESPTPEPVAVSGDTAPAAEIPAEPKEPAPPPRPVAEGELVYLKLSEAHPFHTFRPHPFKVKDDDALTAKTSGAVDRFHALAGELRDTEAALAKTSGLMAATVEYAKTRPVFDGYKAARYSKKYLAEHEAELTSYRAAKVAMNDILAGAKLPKMDALKKSRRALAEKKKALYAEYRKAQQDMREAVAIKANIDHLLGVTGGRENKAQER